MRILMLHNYYQRRGGEDEAAEQEVHLLRSRGHSVLLYSRHNDEIKSFSLLRKGRFFFETAWSAQTSREVRQAIVNFRPDVAHLHNFFPLISPSVVAACESSRVPLVYTLHDYRLLCPIGLLFRDGAICEECMAHSLWQSVRHGCYHGSRLHTAAVALSLGVHRLAGTWNRNSTTYVALTEFSRRKFIQGGLPAGRILLRPNFLMEDPGAGADARSGVLFVGRLSREKGVEFLVEAWKNLPDIPLTIVGDGELRPALEDRLRRDRMGHVRIAGFLPLPAVLAEMKKAALLVVPSLWYETFGRIIIESYAAGTPVLASRLGAMADLVRENRTGLLFQPGNAHEFLAQVRRAVDNPAEARAWGRQAREAFDANYSAAAAYRAIMTIYEQAIAAGHGDS